MTVQAPASPDERAPEQETANAPGSPAVSTTADAGTGTADAPSAPGVDARAIDVVAAPAIGVVAAPAIGVRLVDDGIIEVLLPPNQEIEGPEARVAGGAVRSLAAGRRMPVLLVITGVVGVSVEARQVFSGSIAATAFALVGESPVDRVIAHYLLRARSESIPAQFFSSEAAALEWLRQHVREK